MSLGHELILCNVLTFEHFHIFMCNYIIAWEKIKYEQIHVQSILHIIHIHYIYRITHESLKK